MEVLGFFGGCIWILPLVLAFRLLIVVNFYEEGDGYALKVGLPFLANPVFLQVEDIPYVYKLLFQFPVVRDILPISIEPYRWT